jgi:hypothetical protein
LPRGKADHKSIFYKSTLNRNHYYRSMLIKVLVLFMTDYIFFCIFPSTLSIFSDELCSNCFYNVKKTFFRKELIWPISREIKIF